MITSSAGDPTEKDPEPTEENDDTVEKREGKGDNTGTDTSMFIKDPSLMRSEDGKSVNVRKSVSESILNVCNEGGEGMAKAPKIKKNNRKIMKIFQQGLKGKSREF